MSSGPEVSDGVLPPSARIIGRAQREMKDLGLAAAAALAEAFKRRCLGEHLDREDEPLPIGKGRNLHSIRTTLGGDELRLIYGKVQPGRAPQTSSRKSVELQRRTSPPDTMPIRFVGVLAWKKKRRRLPARYGDTAWQRLTAWVADHPEYRID